MAAEVLRRRMDDDVSAFVERVQVDGGRDRGVADDQSGMSVQRLPVGHRQYRVRGHLDPDDLRVGRRARLVELDEAQSPGLELPEEHGGAQYAPSASAIVVPGLASARTIAVSAPIPDA